MMNVLALSLVLTSLVIAGVWSPPPPGPDHDHKQNQNQRDVTVKASQRVVVVEYEEEGDGITTKVLISPQEDKDSIHTAGEKFSNAATAATKASGEDVKENFKDAAASLLPNVGQCLSDSYPGGHTPAGPRELVCDAFGKCKHKMAIVFVKTKDKVSEKAHEVSSKVSEKAHEVTDKVSGKAHEVSGKVSEKAHEVTNKVSEKAHEVTDKVLEVEEEAKEAAGEALGKAKDTVTQKTHEAAEKAREVGKTGKGKISEASGKLKEGVTEKAKEMAKDTVAKTRIIGEHIEQNVSRIIENIKEPLKEKANQAEEAMEKAKEEGKKNLNEILKRGREVVYDFASYSLLPETIGPAMGVVHLLGFSMAYGMCLWVTFVASYVMATALPRQQLGMVQSKLYPVYFMAMAYCVGVALMGHLLIQRKRVLSCMIEFQACSLLVSLLMVLTNLLYLEPRATKVMFERMKIGKEQGRGLVGESTGGAADVVGDPMSMTTASAATGRQKEVIAERPDIVRLNEKLKMLNTYSSFLNVLTLMLLTVHLVYLGQRLQLSH